MAMFQTLGVALGVWTGGRKLSAFWFSGSSNPLLSGSSNFSRSSKVFWNSVKFVKNLGGRSVISAWGLDADRLVGVEKNCILYSLFCILIIIMTVIFISSINFYLVVLLNRSFPLARSPPHPAGEGQG